MKRFLLILVFLFLPCLCYGDVLPQVPAALAKMVGEDFRYDISFLWFSRIAEGHLTLQAGEQPGTYRALLEAQTLGVAAWLTKDRMQRYEALMELGPDGLLRSVWFRSQIVKGKGKDKHDRSKVYDFDHQQRQIRYQVVRENRPPKEQILPMPEGTFPCDILTAFYNFRAGLLGPLEPGRRVVVPTYNREDNALSEILADILLSKERGKAPSFPKDGLVVRATVDREVFDTGGGYVYFWLDESSRPLQGVIENVIGLGDVRGTLRK